MIRLMRRVGLVVIHRPGLVAGLAALLTLFLYANIHNLRTGTDLTDMFGKRDPQWEAASKIGKELGYGNQLFVLIEAPADNTDKSADMEDMADRLTTEMAASGLFKQARSGVVLMGKPGARYGARWFDPATGARLGAAALFQRIEQHFGAVDCLVNNAGITRDALLAFMSDDQWDDVIATNLRSTFLCSRLAVLGMMRQGGGSICNIVSPSGVRGQAGQCNYAASKGGMISFTKSLAREAGRFNVRVNAISPGVIPSRMSAKYIEKDEKRILAEIPLGRFGKPEEVASLAVFLASAEASYITGQVIAVDGGIV